MDHRKQIFYFLFALLGAVVASIVWLSTLKIRNNQKDPNAFYMLLDYSPCKSENNCTWTDESDVSQGKSELIKVIDNKYLVKFTPSKYYSFDIGDCLVVIKGEEANTHDYIPSKIKVRHPTESDTLRCEVK